MIRGVTCDDVMWTYALHAVNPRKPAKRRTTMRGVRLPQSRRSVRRAVDLPRLREAAPAGSRRSDDPVLIRAGQRPKASYGPSEYTRAPLIARLLRAACMALGPALPAAYEVVTGPDSLKMAIASSNMLRGAGSAAALIT